MNRFVRPWKFLRRIFKPGAGGKILPEPLKTLPYGYGSYDLIRRKNLYYVDKTGYLHDLEKAGGYLKGYADLVMEPFIAGYEGIKFSYLIEIKYLKSTDGKSQNKLDQLKSEAEKQLKQYEMDEKFRKNIEKTALIKLALVFSGHKLAYIGEVKEA